MEEICLILANNNDLRLVNDRKASAIASTRALILGHGRDQIIYTHSLYFDGRIH